MGMEGYLIPGDTLRVIYTKRASTGTTFTLHSYFNNLNPDRAIFVSNNGTDGTDGQGTFGQPYRTIQRAFQDSTSGDNIVVMAGEYPMITSGMTGVSIVPFADRTGIVDKYPRRYLQSLFEETHFTNHVIFDDQWDLIYSADSTGWISDGYIMMNYDGTHAVQAGSIFSFTPDFEVSAEIRNAYDPVYFEVFNSDNTISFSFNDGDCTSVLITDVDTYTCRSHLSLRPVDERELFTDYLCITSTHIRNKWIPLTFLPTDATNFALNIVGGSSQDIDVDFIVEGGFIKWAGLGLDGELNPGDILRAIYNTRDLSDPVQIKLSVENDIFTARVYDFTGWQTIMKRTLDGTNNNSPWSVSFYMNQPKPGQSHDRITGRGYISKFLAIASSFENTDADKNLLAKTERKSIIFREPHYTYWNNRDGTAYREEL
jgi:hypothetical protein